MNNLYPHSARRITVEYGDLRLILESSFPTVRGRELQVVYAQEILKASKRLVDALLESDKQVDVITSSTPAPGTLPDKPR